MASKILGNIAPVKVPCAEVHRDKNLALNFYLSQTNQQPMQGLLSAYLTQVLTPLHSLPNKNQTFKISKIIKKCTFFTNEHSMQLFSELVQHFSIKI